MEFIALSNITIIVPLHDTSSRESTPFLAQAQRRIAFIERRITLTKKMLERRNRKKEELSC
jgi:hypothetical protein